MVRWGVVATVKAPAEDILRFAAHHLDLGAHRVLVYLDAPSPAAQGALAAHPKCRVVLCDEAHWRRRGRRPVKHQVRQTVNATHAYRRRGHELDWLAHIDVDEFLWPEEPVSDLLAALPAKVQSARLRPAESLAGAPDLFKGYIPRGPGRAETVARLYPRFGRVVKGGFLSHVAGKVFARTGLEDVSFRIHNVFAGEHMNPGEVELGPVQLCHLHARGWPEWLAAYRYRLESGAYRADLAPAEPGGPTLHEALVALEAAEGEAGLRAFHDEICAATPALLDRLRAEGLLRRCPLDLAAKSARHFPAAAPAGGGAQAV